MKCSGMTLSEDKVALMEIPGLQKQTDLQMCWFVIEVTWSWVSDFTKMVKYFK